MRSTSAWVGRTYRALALWGIDPRKMLATAKGMPAYRRERAEFNRQRAESPDRLAFSAGLAFPFLTDRYEQAGQASGHYFHQDLFVAREIFRRNPSRHIDVGSSIYGFVSHVATFREIEVLDVRPIDSSVEGIRFVQHDIMTLDPDWEGVCDSVSCLHALEHFGLGRYGDPIDYEGWRRGLLGLTSLLTSGGTLYLSVPIGRNQRVDFNAQRIFSLPFLRDVLSQNYRIDRLASVDDEGSLTPDCQPYSSEAEESYGTDYGCLIWILTKL
jgi:hypothetical protein